jgi:peptide chain release factor 1
MKASIRGRLEQIAERFEEITALLAEPEIQNNQNKFRELSQEYALIEPVVECFNRYRELEQDVVSTREMLNDPEMADLAKEELALAETRVQELEPELQLLLIPADPNDHRNIFLEVRAGTGGAEAALFAGDLLRMYLRYAEQMGWRTETISQTLGEQGGYKEIVIRIS